MSNVLVTFSKDFADEFNVDGFRVYDADVWQDLATQLAACERTNAFWFGTNEGWEEDYELRGEEWLQAFTAEELSDSEYTALETLFGRVSGWGRDKGEQVISFGVFPSVVDLLAEEED